MADIHFIRQLLVLAAEANPPETIGAGEFEDREFALASGWKVVVSYDCGDLDYIEHFVTPAGEKIEIWGENIDSRVDDSAEGIFTTLQNWREVADTARLMGHLADKTPSS